MRLEARARILCRGLSCREAGMLASGLVLSETRGVPDFVQERIEAIPEEDRVGLGCCIEERFERAGDLALSTVHPERLALWLRGERKEAFHLALLRSGVDEEASPHFLARSAAHTWLASRAGWMDPRHWEEMRAGEVLESGQVRLLRPDVILALIWRVGLVLFAQNLRSLDARALLLITRELSEEDRRLVHDALGQAWSWGDPLLSLCATVTLRKRLRKSPDPRLVVATLGRYLLSLAHAGRNAENLKGIAHVLPPEEGDLLLQEHRALKIRSEGEPAWVREAAHLLLTLARTLPDAPPCWQNARIVVSPREVSLCLP